MSRSFPQSQSIRPNLREFTCHHAAWEWRGSRLPQRAELLDSDLLLQAALTQFRNRSLMHVDIGAGNGSILNEMAARVQRNFQIPLQSQGTEIFLYGSKDSNRTYDKRIISPRELAAKVKVGSVPIVTVIAPDPFAPNFANQIISAVNFVHRSGVLFLRTELAYEKGLGLLLAMGFNVADLGPKLSKCLLTSGYIPNSKLHIAWQHNPNLEGFLSSNGIEVINLKSGIERLKLFARSISNCGMHRRRFKLSELESRMGLSKREIINAADNWKQQVDQLYLKRLNYRGGNTITA